MFRVSLTLEPILLVWLLFGQGCASTSDSQFSIDRSSENQSTSSQQSLHLLTNESEGSVDTKLLNVQRMELVKKQRGQNSIASLSFTIDPHAQFVEYEVCALEQRNDPACSNLALLCGSDEIAVCENLLNSCRPQLNTFGCKTYTSYFSPVEIIDLAPGRYDIKVHACGLGSETNALPCGPYREQEYTQEEHSNARQWAYLHLERELLDQIPVWARAIRENLLLYVDESHEDSKCLEASDHNDLSYAASELDENKIQAGLYDYALRILATKSPKAAKSGPLPFLRVPLSVSLEKQMPFPEQSILFSGATFTIPTPKTLENGGLRQLVDQRLLSAGLPKVLDFDAQFIWQMTASILTVNENPQFCQARQNYNTSAQFIKSKLDALKSQLAIVAEHVHEAPTISGK